MIGSTPLATGGLGATIVPARSTRADQPGGTTKVASGSSKTSGPAAASVPRRARRGGPASRPTRREADRAGSSRSAAPPRRPPGAAGPGSDHRQADVDEDDLAVGVAMSVALLVGALEALDQLAPGRASVGPGTGSSKACPA